MLISHDSSVNNDKNGYVKTINCNNYHSVRDLLKAKFIQINSSNREVDRNYHPVALRIPSFPNHAHLLHAHPLGDA